MKFKSQLRIVTCGQPGAGKTSLLHTLESGLAKTCVSGGEVRSCSSLAERALVSGPTFGAALIVVNASVGLSNETRRLALICGVLRIRRLLLAVNKMDEVGYSKSCFAEILAEFSEFSMQRSLLLAGGVPVDALNNVNVSRQSRQMPWYSGGTLEGALTEIGSHGESGPGESPFRMQVQSINTESSGQCVVTGRVSRGYLKKGDPVALLPSGSGSTVESVRSVPTFPSMAVTARKITVSLLGSPEVRIGDLLCSTDIPATVSDQVRTTLIWIHKQPLLPGRPYILEMGYKSCRCSIAKIRHKVSLESFGELAARTLEQNDIGICNVQLDEPLAFDRYADIRETGRFQIIDCYTRETLGFGMLDYALWRSDNVQWQTLDVDQYARSRLKSQKPCVIWFTGLSGSGKSTIANLVEKRLHAEGHHTYLLDGDNVRQGLNRDLGFTDADRVENIRRVSEVAKLMVDAGLIVLVSFISPFRAERTMARDALQPGEFLEVYVDTSLTAAELRDPKGLYAKARKGLLKNFTGIDSPYEPPLEPDVHIQTADCSAEEASEKLLELLRRQGRLSSIPPHSSL